MRCLIVSRLLLAGCTKPAEQLVVTIDSDLAPEHLMAVHAVDLQAEHRADSH